MAGGSESSHCFSTEVVAYMFVSGELPDEIPSDDSECDDNEVDLSNPEALQVIVLVSLSLVVT